MTVIDTPFRSIQVDVSEFPDLDGASDGIKGKGTFNVRVSGQEQGGKVTLEIMDLSLELENKADKALKDLVGENEEPGDLPGVEDVDDGTDVA